ncbi:hypothetical protein Y887_12085 [Xanthomonas pisi DSM 18956]|uniref:Uncharacterized protein n=1 Tax=Xanthomonas pisi TaxID=56457 RepID=A0A2S7CWG4_9XANT|nr:hypothetical protein Y887_12085 [Xanthomonas pisi DSM 18956]PPU65824.1 hypothetical protein XpiCFBP4643_20025 [Xanthomonas pisi]
MEVSWVAAVQQTSDCPMRSVRAVKEAGGSVRSSVSRLPHWNGDRGLCEMPHECHLARHSRPGWRVYGWLLVSA